MTELIRDYRARMTQQAAQRRVAATLAAYEARSIDAEELHARLLKAALAAGSSDALIFDLLNSVDEASDLGRNEREDIAWAAARYWRSNPDRP